MTTFLSRLGAEVAARRRRLRKALGESRASLVEFALLAGLMLGVVSPEFGPKGFPVHGLFLPVAAIVGYLLIERARQQQADAPAGFDDRRVLLFFGAVAVLGYATFIWANLAPPPFELVPEEAPADALPVTIGP